MVFDELPDSFRRNTKTNEKTFAIHPFFLLSFSLFFIANRKRFIIFVAEKPINQRIMKTIKTRLFIMLWGMLIPMLTANCSDKKTIEKTETAETTAKTTAETESVIKVSAPSIKKFVVVTTEDEGLYKEANTHSPTLTRWIESDCESDFCENIYQWSDQPAKPGFELSTDIMPWEGRVFPVLGEEGDFYKVCTLNEWCTIESAYIPKACVGDIEPAPIKADMLEAEDNDFKCRVIKDGKYKDIVLLDEYDELDGETLQVGVLIDDFVVTPVVYYIDSYLDNEQKDIIIDETEGRFYCKYNKSLAMTADDNEHATQLDLKKLSAGQIAKIVDSVTKKKPEFVNCMVHFPAKGLEYFYYKVK